MAVLPNPKNMKYPFFLIAKNKRSTKYTKKQTDKRDEDLQWRSGFTTRIQFTTPFFFGGEAKIDFFFLQVPGDMNNK